MTFKEWLQKQNLFEGVFVEFPQKPTDWNLDPPPVPIYVNPTPDDIQKLRRWDRNGELRGMIATDGHNYVWASSLGHHGMIPRKINRQVEIAYHYFRDGRLSITDATGDGNAVEEWKKLQNHPQMLQMMGHQTQNILQPTAGTKMTGRRLDWGKAMMKVTRPEPGGSMPLPYESTQN